MQQDAVIRQLEVIGEAVKQLSVTARESTPKIPWRDIAGMRDVLIHEYFSVDVDQVWEVTQRELHDLRRVVEEMLRSGQRQAGFRGAPVRRTAELLPSRGRKRSAHYLHPTGSRIRREDLTKQGDTSSSGRS